MPSSPPATRASVDVPLLLHPDVETSNDGFVTRLGVGELVTDTVAVAVSAALLGSETITRAVHVPTAYRWFAVAADPGPELPPSPNSNRKVRESPSGSLDAEASRTTSSGSVPDGGTACRAATGRRFGPRTRITVTTVSARALEATNVARTMLPIASAAGVQRNVPVTPPGS